MPASVRSEPCLELAPAEGPARFVMSEVQQAAFRDVVPLNVTLELTLACNIRCVHCYNFDRDAAAPVAHGCSTPATPDAAGNPLPLPLSLDEIRRVLQDVRDAGCLFLSLTGGEVLTHPHLFEVMDEARRLNLAVQLLTNGTLLRPGVVGRLAGYRNLLGVSVSLYGATAETHDRVTQVNGSFRRTWEGIDRLRAQGIAVRLKFIVMRQNAGEVEAMIAQAEQRGVPFMVDLTITGRHDGSTTSLASRIGPVELERLYRGPLRGLVPSGRAVQASEWACNCARGNCAITATGDVQPCISVPLVAGNVRQQGFAEIWKSAPLFQRIRGLELHDYPSCAPCPDKDYCSRSRGAAVTASGEYTGTDPFVCESAGIARRVAEQPT